MKLMITAFAEAADLRDDLESVVTENGDQRDICANSFGDAAGLFPEILA